MNPTNSFVASERGDDDSIPDAIETLRAAAEDIFDVCPCADDETWAEGQRAVLGLLLLTAGQVAAGLGICACCLAGMLHDGCEAVTH